MAALTSRLSPRLNSRVTWPNTPLQGCRGEASAAMLSDHKGRGGAE